MHRPPSRLPKHLREVLDRLPGWQVAGINGSGHAVLQHQTGARTSVSLFTGGAPSPRHIQNTIRSAKRALAEVRR